MAPPARHDASKPDQIAPTPDALPPDPGISPLMPIAPRFGDSPAPAPRRRRLKSSGAVWQQIADELRAQIESGDLAVGQPIPSESQMMQQYSVSRSTVRQAVAALRNAGLLTVQRGLASTVRAAPSTRAELLPFDFTTTPSSNSPPKTAPPTYTTWDTRDWQNAEEPVTGRMPTGRYEQLLRLAPVEPLFVLHRQLRHTSGVEVIQRVYVPFVTAENIEPLTDNPFRAPADLYRVLTEAGHVLHWSESLETVMPSPEEATALDIPDGVPVFVHHRLTLDTDDRPLALEETRLPGDRVRILMNPAAAQT